MIVKIINKSTNKLPEYKTLYSAGMDICSNEDAIIGPRQVKLIKTGLFVEIPIGYEIQVRPRSGLALNEKISVLNTPGTIDCVPPGTTIKTISGNKLVDELFISPKKEIISSFNEEIFDIEEDILSDIWTVKNKECIVISTNNHTISIPLEKEVFTRRGWIKAYELTINDEILVLNE